MGTPRAKHPPPLLGQSWEKCWPRTILEVGKLAKTLLSQLCLRVSSSYVFLLVDNVGPDKFAVGKILEGRGQHKHASLKALKLRSS